MIKVPYGISNFAVMREAGYHFVDRTGFLRALEALPTRYHFFLRPRRFGKSLWLSIMEHYHDQRWASRFQDLFGGLDIGRNPTSGANQFLVLSLDFSGVNTADISRIEKDFLIQIQKGAYLFLDKYPEYFSAESYQRIDACSSGPEVLYLLSSLTRRHAPGKRIYLLIDEYDHFTNRLLVSSRDQFRGIVGQDGFYRAFFEAVKIGTQERAIERLFITGVSPVTLDSLTSGFNIGHNLTLDLHFHDMLGFKDAEVESILRGSGIAPAALPATMDDMRRWYNGYRFEEEAPDQLYNPDMVLYFAREYQAYGKYPKIMLDYNIASDYGRIMQTLHLGDFEANAAVLEELLREGWVAAELNRQFSMDKTWTRDDFISLLFYNGLVTVKEGLLNQWAFQIPNHVIRELYYGLFQELILRQAGLSARQISPAPAAAQLALRNDPRPFFELVCQVLAGLDNRDYRGLDEKHVKSVAAALLFTSNVYFVRSEAPVGDGYVDLLLLQRPSVEVAYQLAIELKYLKKKDAKKAPAALADAKAQLRESLTHPDLKNLTARGAPLRAWAAVIVGAELYALEEVTRAA
jgi:hypothetical protein